MSKAMEFTRSVFTRPTMYTLQGSYEECVAFLIGYFSGLAVGSHHDASNEWVIFQAWLAQTLDTSPSEVWRKMANSIPDKKEANATVLEYLAIFENLQSTTEHGL